jgi:hypothetical protein
VEVKPPGPLHDQVVVLLVFAVSVAVVPTHTGPLFVAPEEDGPVTTETDAAVTLALVHPVPGYVTDTLYMPAEAVDGTV